MRSSRDHQPLSSSRYGRNELQVPTRGRRGTSLSPQKEEEALRRSESSSRLSNLSSEIPEAKSPYNGLTHGVRRIVPAELACRMGCRGIRCKYDRSDCWEKYQMAIKGLYSHWYV